MGRQSTSAKGTFRGRGQAVGVRKRNVSGRGPQAGRFGDGPVSASEAFRRMEGGGICKRDVSGRSADDEFRRPVGRYALRGEAVDRGKCGICAHVGRERRRAVRHIERLQKVRTAVQFGQRGVRRQFEPRKGVVGALQRREAPQAVDIEPLEAVAAAVEPLEVRQEVHVQLPQGNVAALQLAQVREFAQVRERGDPAPGAVERHHPLRLVARQAAVAVEVVLSEAQRLERLVEKGEVEEFVVLGAAVVDQPAGRAAHGSQKKNQAAHRQAVRRRDRHRSCRPYRPSRRLRPAARRRP